MNFVWTGGSRLALSAVGLLALCGAASADFFDDFNRADGGLGANWTNITAPPINVLNNKANGTAAGLGMTLVQSSAFTGAYTTTMVSADLSLNDTSTTLAYCGLIIGNDGTNTADHGFMVKLQRQATSGFDNIGIYTGSSTNSANVTTAGGNFQALAAPITSCRMSLWFSDPSTLMVGLDTDFNGTNDVTYSSTLNLGGLTLGNRVGMHIYGTNGQIDNFRASTVPEPASMAALGLGALALLRRKRSK